VELSPSPPSPPPSLEDPDSVGASNPRTFAALWAVLRTCFLSSRARTLSLEACIASRLSTSSGRLASHGSLWTPLRPLRKAVRAMKR
jgi:hypothetical protein